MSMPKPTPMPIIHLAEQYFQPKIDLIQHLIQYSQNILLILAPTKGGKTAFANFCLTHSTPELKKHFLLVTPDLSIESMMDNIANGFGMSWPPQEPSPNVAVQKIWTLFVDDAHLLSSDKLEALLRLVNFHQEPKRQLHLVLFGEDKLAYEFSVDSITHLVGNYSTIIELALPQNWQLKSAYHSIDSSSSPIRSEEILKANFNLNSKPNNKLNANLRPPIPNYPEFGTQTDDFSAQVQSEGDEPTHHTHPDFEETFEFGGKPNFNATLNDDPLADSFDIPDRVENGPVPLEKRHRALYKNLFFHPVSYGLYLGFFVGVSALIWQGKESDRPKFVEESHSLPLATSESESKFESDLVLVEPPVAQAQKAIALATFQADSAIEQNSRESFESANIIQSEPKPAPKIKKPRATNAVVSKSVVNKSGGKLANKAQDLKTAKRVNKPKRIEPQRMASPEKAILAKNSTHYTVQLYSSAEPQKVAYFKQQHGLDKAWVIRKKHQGKTWHVLVLGDYTNKSQATRAIGRLPKSVSQAKIKPWVRDFASVQKEIGEQGKRG